ncbi:MAG: DUF2782 domain-containing protein [Gallionella sp.]
MRALALLLLISLPFIASAETQQPANLEPLPPPVFDAGPDSSADAPEITITRQTEQTIEEYRVSGRLYMIKITPKIGPPYYLVDDQGNGKFSRQESLDSGLRPPRWIIKSF